jgi:hypothetical protein
MACMRSLSICGLYGFEISIYILWCALFMHVYVICDICIIVTRLDYHLITHSFRHPTNCMIYVLKLPHAHILVCNDLFVLYHGCIHLGRVSCINHGIKLFLLLLKTLIGCHQSPKRDRLKVHLGPLWVLDE